MIDRRSVEGLIQDARAVFDKINANLTDRDAVFQATLSAAFLSFAAPSQILKTGPNEQIQQINLGLTTVAQILSSQGAGAAARYGRARKCAPVTVDMAKAACELAKKEIDQTNLVVHRKEARDAILSGHLLAFCVTSNLLSPDKIGQGAMMSMANERVAEVLKSGWLDRNVVKVQ